MVLFLFVTWEQRKAKTLFISYAEKGYPELPVLSATQDKGMVYRDDTGKNIFHDKNNEISYKRVQPGQFVIHLRSFQGGFAHSNILGITSPAYTIFGFKDDEKQCDLYWKYVFCSSEFVKRLETVTYGIRDGRSISYDEFLIMKFIVPKYEEQVQIASILIEIDNLITLHQCKDFALDTNKAFQQRCLLSIKSANAWEQRKVGELLIERNEQTPKSDEYPLMAFIANEGVAPKGERYDRSSLINDTENKLYKRTEYGDFIYSSNNLETGSIGVNKYGNATISPVYSIFYTTELADSDFIGRRLIRKDFINEMVKWRQGVIYGQWRIHEDDFVKIKICVPKTCEQRKIGAILDNLDNLITLHQRKQTIKKRSKMDEKRRVNYLMIANAWEQRKLGEVGKAQSGIGFPDREQGGKDGVPFYKVSDMNNYGNEHEMYSANNYVTEEQCRRNGWTPITEISVIFAKVGAAIMLNRKRLVRFSFLLDNNTMAYKFGSDWNIDFGKTLFERIDLTELVQIGALPSYNATDIESLEISMPDKPEQYQIGKFFRQLDNLITLHQRGLIKIQGDKKWQKRKFQKNCSAIILNAG